MRRSLTDACLLLEFFDPQQMSQFTYELKIMSGEQLVETLRVVVEARTHAEGYDEAQRRLWQLAIDNGYVEVLDDHEAPPRVQ